MALPQTREELLDYCLRELGAPVLQINLDEDQAESRVDEALEYFKDYHFDGVEHCVYIHKVTASKANFGSAVTDEFTVGETITGGTSGARAMFISKASDNLSIEFRYAPDNTESFVNGETITGEQSATVGTLAASDAIILGDLDNRYIVLPDKIISVVNILPFSMPPGNSNTMFDVRYQFALTDMYNFTSADLITYDMFKKHIALWDFLFGGSKRIHYNRKTDKVYLETDWTHTITPGMFLVFETWAAIDPEAYKEVYKDLFVRKYTTALLKRQWGANLKKYNGIALPGGVTLNGQQIYDEANAEIEKLEKRIEREWQLPPDFIMG